MHGCAPGVGWCPTSKIAGRQERNIVALNYPLTLSFKAISFGRQASVVDASGQMVAYVRQKALKIKEDVTIFCDDSQQRPLYRVNADRVFDYNANYSITTPDGVPVGSLRREGTRSLLKATYRISDAQGLDVGVIHEENAWIKLADAAANQVPFVGMLSGYIFNPAYLVEIHGANVLYLKKRPAFLEGRFTLEKRGEVPDEMETLLLPSVLMTAVLERERG